MITKLKILFFSFFLVLCSGSVFSQVENPKGDAVKEEDEFAEKRTETKLTEVVVTDSLPPGELLQRAVNWIKVESKKYKKSSGTTTSSKAECTASFPVKPKELNPEVDYTGKITMKVVIDCKDNRYKYTISEIKHISKSGRTTAGSIDNKVPECGSQIMHELAWKKLKGEALRDAALVVTDIKEGMMKISKEAGKEEW
jgi:hypothetical protein